MAIKTLKEFRKQYPQYNDMTDVELADALHAKYYADMPKQKFLQTIEVAAPSIQKTLPAKKRRTSTFWCDAWRHEQKTARTWAR